MAALVLERARQVLSTAEFEHAALEQALRAAAMRQFHALVPCRIDRLSVFVEPAPGADFKLLHQLQLQP